MESVPGAVATGLTNVSWDALRPGRYRSRY